MTQDANGAASGVAITSARQPLVDDLTVRQTGAIAYALSGLVNERIEAQQQHGLRRAREHVQGGSGAARPARRRGPSAAGSLTTAAGSTAMFQRKPRFVSVAFVRGPLPLLGPAFVAAIAYIDPGNFATNITAGSRYGYLLVWVVVVSNLMAMLIQYLSAKAGIATGKNLPELCRDHFPRPVTRGLWVQAELVAIATDLAEVLGGAIALQLLFGLPLLAGGVITAAVAFGLLGLQSRGARPFEVAITGHAARRARRVPATAWSPAGSTPRDAVAGLVPQLRGHGHGAARHRACWARR